MTAGQSPACLTTTGRDQGPYRAFSTTGGAEDIPDGGAEAPPSRAGLRAGRWRVLVAAAVGGAALAGGVASLLQPGWAGGGVKTITIRAFHSRFEPDRVTVKPGETVRFVIHNVDPIEHEFIIGPPEIHDLHERGAPHFHAGTGEVTVPAGATVETTWTFGPPGSPDVTYGCHLAGHWAYGMHGKALIR